VHGTSTKMKMSGLDSALHEHPADYATIRTVEGMPVKTATRRSSTFISSHGGTKRRGFTFFEVIVTLLLAAMLAVVAVPIYNWAFGETSYRLAKIDAQTFERNVRALANTDLRAPSANNIVTVIDTMTEIDDELTITVSGEGFNVTRGESTFCVIFGEEPNKPGTITSGSCI
jgi:prepilin-type N-terminal cleavage/methylation domain-containing protein